MKRFIPLRPLTYLGLGNFAEVSDTVVYVNLDHVISVTMRGKVAFVVTRDKRVIRCLREDFKKQMELIHESK
ncbi:hypothetical protein VZO05_10810 [Aggregatilineales bacterium SYSU G02658]